MALLTRFLRLALAGAFGAAVLGPAAAAARQARAGEEAVKAAFLYNFTKYINWPQAAFADQSAGFNVCVLAGDGFRRALRSTLMGEQVGARQIVITEPGPGDDLTSCHLVYFQDAARAEKRLAALRQAPVLTVGEGAGFLGQGGVIAFTLENNRVRFDISKRRADAAGLVVSSKLLRVARYVEGAPGP